MRAVGQSVNPRESRFVEKPLEFGDDETEDTPAAASSQEEFHDLNLLRPDGSVRNPFQVGWKEAVLTAEEQSDLTTTHEQDQCSSDENEEPEVPVALRSAVRIANGYKPATELLDPVHKSAAKCSRAVWNPDNSAPNNMSTEDLSCNETSSYARTLESKRLNFELEKRIAQSFKHYPTDEEILAQHFRHSDEADTKMQILRAQVFGENQNMDARNKWYETTLLKNERQQVITANSQREGVDGLPSGNTLGPAKMQTPFQTTKPRNTWPPNSEETERMQAPGQEVPLFQRFGAKRLTSGFLDFKSKVEGYRLLFEKSARTLWKAEETHYYDTNRPNFGWPSLKTMWDEHVSLVDICGTELRRLHPKLRKEFEREENEKRRTMMSSATVKDRLPEAASKKTTTLPLPGFSSDLRGSRYETGRTSGYRAAVPGNPPNNRLHPQTL